MILKYNQYTIIDKYYNEDIDSYEVIEHLFGNVNEGLVDDIGENIKLFFKKIKQYIKTNLLKTIKLIDSLIGFIKTIANKRIVKYIVCLSIYLIFMAVFNDVIASEIIVVGGKYKLSIDDIDKCNAAISWIDKVLTSYNDYDNKTLLEAKYFLNDLKDGKFDDVGKITDKGMLVGRTSLKYIENLIQDANMTQDKDLMNKILTYVKDGGLFKFK